MNINWLAPYNSLGYGIASKNLLRELNNKHNVAYFPIGNIDIEYEHEKEIILKSIKNAQFYDSKAPTIKMWHQNALAETVGRGEKIAFPFFELNKFKEIEKHHLLQQDKIFVASQWGKKIIEENNIDIPTFVVPLGVDLKIFNHNNRLHNKNIYRFIHIGKWEIRKGADIIVDTFNKAFTKDDDVELIMACHNPFLDEVQTKEWHDLYTNSPLGNKIQVINGRFRTQQELSALISRCDAGIFPARAEGWNLDLLECLASGLHVIATNYSGHTEFCNKDNALLIDCPNLEPAYDGIWFHGHGEWAELSSAQIDQAVEYMRYLYKNNIRSNQNGIETGKKFTWENSAKKLVSALE